MEVEVEVEVEVELNGECSNACRRSERAQTGLWPSMSSTG